jgi:hypothetical protein
MHRLLPQVCFLRISIHQLDLAVAMKSSFLVALVPSEPGRGICLFFLFMVLNMESPHITNESDLRFAWSFSIIGLVVEFVVAIDEARV